ncbi:MAG: glycosyltransferase family 2 protein [Actinomycetota bacterium]|nr:glycosyltransferase family 2 protein [Actinomycetota bacterium]
MIVPARNAAHFLDECLASIAASNPREIIVVDGNSSDASRHVSRRYTDRVLSDEGRGLPVARMLGLKAATSRWVALVDADVVMPPGAIGDLLDELADGEYLALQAGVKSVSGPGYWGRALAHHHRAGRSRYWFGLVTTVMERSALLELGFDERFLSGEDIDLRWRLRQRAARVGVSRRVVVLHRFEDSFAAARAQWTMDGRGLARMLLAHKLQALPLVLLPLGGFLWGTGRSLVHLQPHWIPYFIGYLAFNYAALAAELLAGLRPWRRVHVWRRTQANSVRP